MPFEKFIRRDYLKGGVDKPLISIRPHHIGFNSEFTRKADLKKYAKVAIFFDRKNYRIGFKFHNNKDDKDSLGLWSDSKRKTSRATSIVAIEKKEKWISEITKLDPSARQFDPKWDNIEKAWIIQVCPAFENKVSNISDLPKGKKGIYRYRRGEEVVYMGKGEIKTRINAPERKDWDFDTVEYSIIEDEEEQFKWEKYWLDRFVELHDKLPIYNMISGHRK